MIICPVCGAMNYREGIQCPLHGGEPVCMDCCKGCKYHISDVYSFPCKFYVENPHSNTEKKIESLIMRIASAEEEVRRLNHNREFKETDDLQLRIRKMVREKRILEEGEEVGSAKSEEERQTEIPGRDKTEPIAGRRTDEQLSGGKI